MNRVTLAIAKTGQTIADRIASGATTAEKVVELHKTLDMDLDEYCLLQERKSLAAANGRLSQDEAVSVYGYLGNTVDHFNSQPIEVKVILTKLFQELLQPAV